MPEISARDLRRLESLEGRLSKAQSERRTLAEERRELRAAVAANARAAREADRRAAAAGNQLEGLLAENRKLAARLDEVAADLERLRSAADELRQQADEAQAQLAAAQEELAKAQRELEVVKSERDQLAERVKIADSQLAGKGMTPVLRPKDVAVLVGEFVSEVSSGLPGMVVRDGEVRLEVAFAKVGTATGFVVPSAEAPDEVRKNLHEVAIRFDRSVELPS
jgi:predicted RNase H-like nuclease (RuvC/YqgF family)